MLVQFGSSSVQISPLPGNHTAPPIVTPHTLTFPLCPRTSAHLPLRRNDVSGAAAALAAAFLTLTAIRPASRLFPVLPSVLLDPLLLCGLQGPREGGGGLWRPAEASGEGRTMHRTARAVCTRDARGGATVHAAPAGLCSSAGGSPRPQSRSHRESLIH